MSTDRDIVTPFHEALQRGELIVQQCSACQRLIMYPKHRCPFCQSAELGWTPVSGEGVLHSIAVHRVGVPSGFEGDVPYAVGVVKLAEGVQLLARLTPDPDGEWSGYACDGPVRFQPTPHRPPVMGPAVWFERVPQ
jgi:uncharacterized OB-fold protein